MFPPASSWLVSTSQLCILSESCSSCPDTQPAHCTSSVNQSAKEHRSSISTVPPPPAGIPPHLHLLHPQIFVSSIADVFSFSIPFSHSLIFSYICAPPLHLPGDSMQTTTPRYISSFISLNHTLPPCLLHLKALGIRIQTENDEKFVTEFVPFCPKHLKDIDDKAKSKLPMQYIKM